MGSQLSLLFVCAILLNACSGTEVEDREGQELKSGKRALTLHSEIGTVRTIECYSETAGKYPEMESELVVAISERYEFTVMGITDEGNFLIEFRYLSYDMDQYERLDGTMRALPKWFTNGNPHEIYYSKILRKRLNFVVGPTGRVVDIEGLSTWKRIADAAFDLGAVNEIYKVPPDKALQQIELIRAEMSSEFTYDAMCAKLENYFHLYSETPVDQGQTWNPESLCQGSDTSKLDTQYKLLSIDEEKIMLSTES